jgi:hypothetical protein
MRFAAVIATHVIPVHRGVEMDCRSSRVDEAGVCLELYITGALGGGSCIVESVRK